jgi:hypothetical protein
MMPTGLFSQIALVALSVGVIFMYVKPALDEVKKTQDAISVYETEYTKVYQVNEKLNRLFNSLNVVNLDDKQKLLTYMPDVVDTVAVPRDIKAITDKEAVILRQIKYVGLKQKEIDNGYIDPLLTSQPIGQALPEAHVFLLNFEGSYGQVKAVLRNLEQNAYPLEVHNLAIEKSDGGFLNVTMDLITYDRITPPAPVIETGGS